MSLYEEVKVIVDNFDKAGTSTELDHALLEILYFCDSSDYFGDAVETGDIRSIVEKRLGEARPVHPRFPDPLPPEFPRPAANECMCGNPYNNRFAWHTPGECSG